MWAGTMSTELRYGRWVVGRTLEWEGVAGSGLVAVGREGAGVVASALPHAPGGP